MVKKLLILLFCLMPIGLRAQTPIVGAHAAAVTSTTKASVTLSVKVSDLVFVTCIPDPSSSGLVVSDSSGDTYAPFTVAVSHDTSTVRSFWTRAISATATLIITCTAPSALTYNQIYATVVSGGGTPVSIAASGSTAPAVATIAGSPGDLVLAMVESGAVANATGWTSLLVLDSNLLASITATTATSSSASFSTTGPWNIVLIDIPPAIFSFQLIGGPKITFPMAVPPSCTSTDGIPCSIQLQFTAPAAECSSDGTTMTCTGTVGKFNLIKNVTLPAPQVIVLPVAATVP